MFPKFILICKTVFQVMVLDAGRVVEFEPPNSLLRKKDSIFYGMVDEAGLVPKDIGTIPEDLMELAHTEDKEKDKK